MYKRDLSLFHHGNNAQSQLHEIMNGVLGLDEKNLKALTRTNPNERLWDKLELAPHQNPTARLQQLVESLPEELSFLYSLFKTNNSIKSVNITFYHLEDVIGSFLKCTCLVKQLLYDCSWLRGVDDL